MSGTNSTLTPVGFADLYAYGYLGGLYTESGQALNHTSSVAQTGWADGQADRLTYETVKPGQKFEWDETYETVFIDGDFVVFSREGHNVLEYTYDPFLFRRHNINETIFRRINDHWMTIWWEEVPDLRKAMPYYHVDMDQSW